jgi:hypothetical protein
VERGVRVRWEWEVGEGGVLLCLGKTCLDVVCKERGDGWKKLCV